MKAAATSWQQRDGETYRIVPGAVEIQSKSEPGVIRTVIDGYCSCPGWAARQSCRHLAFAAKIVEVPEALEMIPVARYGWPDAPLAGRLWTSRYQSGDLILASGLSPVRVTVGNPRFRLPYTIQATVPELAPPRWALKGLTPGQFASAYFAKLEQIGVETIRWQLDAIREVTGSDPVLLCFEDVTSPGVWCHRLLFAQWWEQHTGEAVLELAPSADLTLW